MIIYSHETYIKDTEDPFEVQCPGGYPAFIILCVEKASDHVPFPLLDDVTLDIGHSSAIQNPVSEWHHVWIIIQLTLPIAQSLPTRID